jgi:hypothetical protein
MEAACTSETSVDNYFTAQYIPEDKSELHTRRRENLKSHITIEVRKMGFWNGTWTELAYDLSEWKALVLAVLELRVLLPERWLLI